jgi:hypothetical protein
VTTTHIGRRPAGLLLPQHADDLLLRKPAPPHLHASSSGGLYLKLEGFPGRRSHLPPYSPELNAIEKVWQYLRDRYLSGRLFAGEQAIVDACCAAWNSRIAEPGRIRSLADFEWA